uniref:Uncharacterized protein n=1 Tax=Arundo donax TaxID=35708 RepID=A0A0A9CV13_ARUDO
MMNWEFLTKTKDLNPNPISKMALIFLCPLEFAHV